MMKNLFAAFTMLLSAGLYAQQWAADLDSGFDLARSSGRNVLLLFSVTDGCATCEKLEKTIFADPAFLEYASTRYVLVREDFSIVTAQTKSNHLLIVEKYNRDGFFPLVLVLDASGRVIKKTGPYEGEDPSQYIAMLQKL